MNKNTILLLAFFFVIVQGTNAQDYMAEGAAPNLHVSHLVAARETWYSIGRQFNLPPKDIAAYNKQSIIKPLDIGQQVNIPLTASNFSQNDATRASENFVPVYHVVQPKEWLYRISVNYNKVPVATLQKWNGIGKDGAKPGTRLIVGYLKVKDAGAATVAESNTEPVKTTPVAKKESDDQSADGKKSAPALGAVTAETTAGPLSDKAGSYFKDQFDDSGKSSSGITGIFKSTSGWKDGKYYALVSNVPVGTIVKVTYVATGKVIYAKVLGELPEMKESEGLALRISDAAAGELGSPESKFSVNIKY